MTTLPLNKGSDLPEVTERSGVVLLDFWQASCAPCRALEPRLDQLSHGHPAEFEGYRIDVDADDDTVASYAVMTIPTVVVLRDGRETRLDSLIREADLERVLDLARTTGHRA